MNVLVYSGPEVLQSSLSRSLSSLRSVLYPHYTIQAVTLQSLLLRPWTTSCALLVFPACREQLVLPSSVASAIKSFVEGGGSFLGLRAAARIGGALSSVDPADYSFRFQDRASGSNIYLDLPPGGEDQSRRTSIKSPDGVIVDGVLETTTFSFGGLDQTKNTYAILGRRADSDEVVAASFRADAGNVAAWTVHVEAPVHPQIGPNSEEQRKDLLRNTLRALGLKLPTPDEEGPSHPLPQLLTAAPTRPDAVDKILNSLGVRPPTMFEDSHDIFMFHAAPEGEDRVASSRIQTTSPDDDTRHIIAYRNGALPSKELTPLFDLASYFSTLVTSRSDAGLDPTSEGHGFGEVLLYGEVVTSTQTLLDKNLRLLPHIPSPFLSLATHQIAGRGRGGNSWVSPVGCLQFSLRLRVPLSHFPAARLVFVQYLFALAVTEACRDEGVLGSWGDRVRIKWPNDVYVMGAGGTDRVTKVAGILVYTAFDGDAVDIIIGCGLNVASPPPIASLASVIPSWEDRTLSMERTMAILMAKFEVMWDKFLENKGSFEPFMDLYLDRWLHTYAAVSRISFAHTTVDCSTHPGTSL
ncbi:hypothetical protein NM688_g5181 [Phlebia brevispora]|uniref:Uncharacterized protein n=1 Tax=Phlebia brevispora TaxID=194682 RepID=A0ACC1SZI0_9APHY|nr:hypothetical protein NM688_g5181 [Phlebia brevispora]